MPFLAWKSVAHFCLGACMGAGTYFLSQNPSPVDQLLHAPVVHRRAYVLSYDMARRNPHWVYEHLTSGGPSLEREPEKTGFLSDPSIPSYLQATSADFKGSGFDRGHLCPAADCKGGSKQETFYLTNICPQYPEFNRGYWKKIEKHVRDLTKIYSDVHVFTGPLYLPHQERDGNWYVKYRVIGKSFVAVPTHFFKFVVADTEGKGGEEFAYVVPHARIGMEKPLAQFQITKEKLETLTGIVFPSRK